MYICPNCNTQSEQQMNFCPRCGNTMTYIEDEKTIAPPSYTPVVAQQAVPVRQEVAVQTQVQKPHLAKKIVGMALSIFGLFMAGMSLLYTLIGAAAFGYEDVPVGLIYAIVFDMFSLPCSIVGLAMSKGNINLGDTSAMSRVGKSLGIVGIVLAGVAFLLGLVTV